MSERIDRLIDKVTVRRLRRAEIEVEAASNSRLREIRDSTKEIERHVLRVSRKTKQRLISISGNRAAIRKPMHSDWAWRPELWSEQIRPQGIAPVISKMKIGTEAKIFHDCPEAEIAIRQELNAPNSAAHFCVQLDVFQFTGSFLSLVIDLPEEGISGLSNNNLVRLNMQLQSEIACEIYGRLNFRHEPNVDQIVRKFEGDQGEISVEFDLAEVELNETRLGRAWIEIIFEQPEFNQFNVRDLTLSRRPRASV